MKIHNLGFPRIGAQRELKKALESFWKGLWSEEELLQAAKLIRVTHWRLQSFLDLVPVGDFSFYDQVLDMSFMLGNVPERAAQAEGSMLDQYFRVARGRSSRDLDDKGIQAGEMTKWFDTNYHYIVPEFRKDTSFCLQPKQLIEQLEEARAIGCNAKPVIIGPITYLWLGKEKDGSNKYDLLEKILPIYRELLTLLAEQNVEWVQIDEPVLATDLDGQHKEMLRKAYGNLSGTEIKLLLTSYFGELQENLDLALTLPVEGLHIDAVRGRMELDAILAKIPENKILSLGLIDGRNIWKTNLEASLERLESAVSKLSDRVWLAPSCSLLHVPVDLEQECEMDKEVKSWLAFAVQKLDELKVLSKGIKLGRGSIAEEILSNSQSLKGRCSSIRVKNPVVQERLKTLTDSMGERKSPYQERANIQKSLFNRSLYPTTTIGSFPQTKEIRSVRLKHRKGEISESEYVKHIQNEIKRVVAIQEDLGLDVLVHGEAERNDMVEYFGEQLDGYIFSHFGWVQSYGSRCVKPPILFGDISRTKPMTIAWSQYAQSLTSKPMKGMLTGPVTILNWSFVRDDQPRSVTCQQIALAIRDEVHDLEKAGLKIIQIDEAALREGLPLRKSQWKEYLRWAVGSYKIAANGVEDKTQIHTHMCYSEFNDIIEAIADMDADVITIETSRSDMELLNIFDQFDYPNEIGPGVYDIHSPNIPTVAAIVELIQKAALRIPPERLWINPDCGLKTRDWKETIASLTNMVAAAKRLRT